MEICLLVDCLAYPIQLYLGLSLNSGFSLVNFFSICMFQKLWCFLLDYLYQYFTNKTVLLERKEASILQFLMILTLLKDRLYTVPFLEHLFFLIFKRLFLLLPSSSWYIRMGIQNNSSHIVLCQKGIQ